MFTIAKVFVSKYLSVGLVIIIGLILAYVFYLKTSLASEKAAYKAFKAEVTLLAVQQEVKTAKTIADQQTITSDAVIAYADSEKRLKAYYEKNPIVKFVTSPSPKLRSNSTTCSSEVPTKSKSSSESDDRTQSSESSTERYETVEVTVYDCASDVLQLLSLQAWERKQETLSQ